MAEHPILCTAVRIAELAVQAAVLEAAAMLKPGLVCMDDPGVHTDMDITTLTTSAFSLQAYFRRAAELGLTSVGTAPQEVFTRLRELGQQAEAVMYAATGGVNTHKGLIFSQGLLCAAAARLLADHVLARGGRGVCAAVCAEAGSLARDTVEQDLRALREAREAHAREAEDAHARTAGETLFMRHGVSGIRGEAAQGFPHVEQGCTVLGHWLTRGTMNQALVNTLLELMAVVEDTNVLHRGGPEKLASVQRMAAAALQRGGACSVAGLEALAGLRQYCLRERLSPGGCADLLALSVFCYLFELECASGRRLYD